MAWNCDGEIREFLIESSENLANFDRDIVQLERDPNNFELISSAFRAIHTIKGTCGFFGYELLGKVSHLAENLLCQVRDRQRPLTPELISLVLEAVDEMKSLLATIEASGSEGADRSGPVRARLELAYSECNPQRWDETDRQTDRRADRKTDRKTDGKSEGDAAAAGAAPAPAPGVGPAPEAETDAAPDPCTEGAETGSRPVSDPARDSLLSDTTIRVDVGLLDRLMNLVGELVLARNQLLQNGSIRNSEAQQTLQRLNLITSGLQEGVMKTRMQPIGVIWSKLPRVVRDLAAQCGKRIRIEMEGACTELDKTILEAIRDPLTHIVRNCCDHGFETPELRQARNKSPEGLLQLRACHEGGVVNIEISDDGAGIDPEKVKAKAIEKGLLNAEQAAQMSPREAMELIFQPGFSTAPAITSLSGRGVGMDVVKTNVEKIGGRVELLNRPQGGTTVRIKIPLTLAIIPGLVVTLESEPAAEAGAASRWKPVERFIIPQVNLLELVRIEGAEVARRIEKIHGTPVFHHRGRLLPLVYLGQVLGQVMGQVISRVPGGAASPVPGESVNLIVLQAENRQLGLVVDRIGETQEIVVKPLGRRLKGMSCYVGATIMGDGRPALILDVAGLARLAGLGAQPRPTAPAAIVADDTHRQQLLLFRAAPYDRVAVPLALVARLEKVSPSRMERAGGRSIRYYRGQILPLVTLSGGELPAEIFHQEAVTIIVFSDGVRRLGLLADQILDVLDERRFVPRPSSLPGLLGSAVVGGQVTDLLDLHALAASAGENWLDRSEDGYRASHTLLLLDPSAAARAMVGDFLSVQGYEIVDAATAAEASQQLRRRAPDALLMASDLSGTERREVLAALAGERGLPVIELLDRAGEDCPQSSEAAQLSGSVPSVQVVRSDRKALLRTLAALVESAALVEAIP